jgi:ribokinase
MKFQRSAITVVGACDSELISYVPWMPALGKTLHGTRVRMGFGGPGANQAITELADIL